MVQLPAYMRARAAFQAEAMRCAPPKMAACLLNCSPDGWLLMFEPQQLLAALDCHKHGCHWRVPCCW